MEEIVEKVPDQPEGSDISEVTYIVYSLKILRKIEKLMVTKILLKLTHQNQERDSCQRKPNIV